MSEEMEEALKNIDPRDLTGKTIYLLSQLVVKDWTKEVISK